MRLTTVILIASLIQVSAASFGQRITLNKSNASLFTVLKEIRKQSGYDFYYDANTIAKDQKVSVAVSNATIEETLVSTLNGLNLVYEIDGRSVSIKKKEESTFLDRLASRWANIDVRGKVIGENNEPLVGATIKVKGTNKVLNSSKNGEFYIQNVDEKATLEISYLGYQSRSVKVEKELGVIYLQIVNNDLSEVSVVSTGYQNIPKERATGSFSKIDNQTYNRQVSTDVISRLKGIAPSLYFDERAGGGITNLNIRGQSTIFGNAKPLIVIDNFPFEGDLRNINPNDVESVTILKDAAAASIWGVRAGNGVIVITTKKGKYNQPLNVEVNSNITIGERPDLFYQSKINPTDFIDIEKMLFDKGYYNATLNNTRTFPALSPVIEILNQQRSNQLSASEATAQIDALRQFDLRNDIEKYFYQKAVNQQYSLSLNGGSDKHNFTFSSSFDNNRQSQVHNSFSRITINTTQNFRPFKNFEVYANLYVNQNKTNSNTSLTTLTNMSSTRQMYPYASLADDSGVPKSVVKDFRNIFKEASVQKGYLNWDFVPLNELELQNGTGTLNGSRISSGASYQIIDGLKADVKFQYERQTSESSFLRDADAYAVRDLVNKFTTVNGTDIKRNIPLGAINLLTNRGLNSINGRAQLNYDKTWNNHLVSVIAGFEARQIKADGSTFQYYGYDPSLGTSSPVNYDTQFISYPSGFSTTIPQNEGISQTVDRFRSYYANAGYTFLNRYSISGSARIDQSNVFGVKANQRAVPLWSVGVKWDVSAEPFYKLDWLPKLSVRSTYGFNGNLDNTLTAFTTAILGRSDVFSFPAARLQNPPNSKLRWERTAQWNLGLDFEIKNNRVYGSIEYYRKQGRDLIGDGVLDPTTGFSTYRGNVAGMKGKGIDLELSSVNLNSKVRWTTTILYSFVTDEVTEYEVKPTFSNIITDGGIYRNTNLYTPIVGKSLFSIFSNPWAGLDPLTGSPRGYFDGVASTDYAAINTQIESDFEKYLVYNGRSLAPHYGAIRNSIDFKNFDFSFNITFRFGNYFRRQSVDYGTLFSQYVTHGDYYDRWQKAGDELITNVPAMSYPANPAADTYYRNSQVLVQKGDNIRLQDVNLSYTFPFSITSRLSLRGLKIFAYANNLGLLWKANDKELDPDYPTNKPIRTIAFGLNCSF